MTALHRIQGCTLLFQPFYQAPSHGTKGRHRLGQATFHVLVDAPGRTAVAESVVAEAKQQSTGHGCNCCYQMLQ